MKKLTYNQCSTKNKEPPMCAANTSFITAWTNSLEHIRINPRSKNQ